MIGKGVGISRRGVLGGIGVSAFAAAYPGLIPAPAGAQEPAGDPNRILTSHGFSTFGALKYPAGFAHLDYVNPDAPKGGEMSSWALGTFDSFNPYSRKGRASALSVMPYESLLGDVADDTAYYGLVAHSLEYPETQDWVVFHMRPEAMFSDGTPVTAHDVAFSHNLLLEQGLPSYAQSVKASIPTVEAIDDSTVRFVFADGVPRKSLIGQAGGTPIWSRAWYEATGARLDESRLETSPGSGPYVIDSYDINRRITLRRNPDYWGRDLPIMQGRANFDTIRVEYFADPGAAFEAFKAGQFTFRQETNSGTWSTGYDFPAVTRGEVVKEELPDGNIPQATGFVFNLRREKFQDLRVRRALALMYNFTWTNNTLQYGLFQQRVSFWQNSPDLQAQGVPEGRELELLQEVSDQIAPEILTAEVAMPHVSGDRQLDRGNLRAALALMQDAGWTPDATGRLNRDGEPFTLEFLIGDPNLDRYITPYTDNLKALGVDATMRRVDYAQYTLRERDHDWDMILDGYLTGPEEGTGMAQRFGSADKDDLFNPAGYGSPALDHLISRVIDATTREEMAAGVRAADRLLRHEMIMVPTWYLGKYWVAYWQGYGRPDTIPPYALGQNDFWWSDKT
ncbi:extracellular solute-binding protein [Falsirhodobacter halotolerans]|uniref:extracellular solute-binding protein n=1 Tax=Falsirhodobacter halotolerans TaxID=1146892 RepID=UPI001FD1C771|nr:extracellular solute-binding protein [Falsirhodobacter halotolerans]MCJ8140500.1 extracellular solute-binding protein [Falsirhodobacter halotolerans]